MNTVLEAIAQGAAAEPALAPPAPASRPALPDDLRARVLTDGFAVLRGLLTAAEVAALRRTCAAFFRSRPHMRSNLGRNLPNAVDYLPEIHWLYRHPHVVAAFRAALGRDDIVFTRHCDVAQNRLSGWHKDSGEPQPYFSGDYFGADDCNVYKMALYLQDHARHRDGLWVRRGSHRAANHRDGEALHLDTAVGDAIVFDVRLTHSGQFPDFVERRLKRMSAWWAPRGDAKRDREFAVRLKDLYWRLRGRSDRHSVFFTFGAPNAFTREFAARNMARQDAQNARTGAGPGSANDAALFAALRGLGVAVFGAD